MQYENPTKLEQTIDHHYFCLVFSVLTLSHNKYKLQKAIEFLVLVDLE